MIYQIYPSHFWATITIYSGKMWNRHIEQYYKNKNGQSIWVGGDQSLPKPKIRFQKDISAIFH